MNKKAFACYFVGGIFLFILIFLQASACVDRISKHEALRVRQQQEQAIVQDIPSPKLSDQK